MSLEKLIMPQLGESVTEGTINSWLVKEGSYVNKYDPIADVLTDKVNAEIPSSFAGTIKEIVAEEGDTIDVGEVICYIEVVDNDRNKQASNAKVNDEVETPPKKAKDHSEDSMKKRYSPAVLKMAQDHEIDLNHMEGSGRGGRITRKDMEKVILGEKTQPVKVPSGQINKQKEQTSSIKSATADQEIPLTGVRKAIAENMLYSTKEIPHAWMTVEVDVTDLVKYRTKIKESFKASEGYNITFFAFFVKAVAQALINYPQLNSTWDGDKVFKRKDINLSIAVAKDDELYVPVIKHADEKSIKGIAREINELAVKARTDKLVQSDMEDGTFTVNNTGSFGSIHSMGIINHPQAAILQVESIVKRPVIIDDMFAARDMVNLSLSIDHRILDGLVAGKFLQNVKEILENTNEKTTNIF